MNKQIHVHSVNQWVACRLSSSRCRAHWSIGSVDAHTDAPRTRRTVRTRKQNRMAHTGPRACVRAWAKDFLPSRAPRRPVALLPELRRIVTRLDMPPRPRPAPRAHAHTIAFHFEHLIIMAHRSWNCCRSPAPAHSTTTSSVLYQSNIILLPVEIEKKYGTRFVPSRSSARRCSRLPDAWHHSMQILSKPIPPERAVARALFLRNDRLLKL